MQSAMYTKGQVEQVTALMDLQSATAATQGTNAEYAAQLANGTMQTAQFAAGQAEANKALNELQGNTAHTLGVLNQYIANLASGKQQAAEFAAGQADAAMKIAQLRGETANLQGQFSVLTTALNSASAQQIEYNNGVLKGATDTAQWALGLANASGEAAGTRGVVEQLSGAWIDSTFASRISTEGLQQFIGVMKGAPDAVDKLVSSLTQFSSGAISSVADAMLKGKDEVGKAIKDIETQIQGTLTQPETKIIMIEAQTENAVNAIENNISLALNFAANGSTEAFHNAMARAIDDAQKQFEAAGGTLKTVWSNIMTDMHNIDQDPLNSQKLIQDAALLVTHLEAVGQSGDQAKLMLQGLGLTTAQVDQAMAQANASATGTGTALTGVGTGAASSDPIVAAFAGTLSGMLPIFGTLETVAVQVFEQFIPQAVAIGTAGIVGAFSTILPGTAPIFGTLQTMAQQTFMVAIPANAQLGTGLVVAAFNTLPPAIVPMLGNLQTLAQQTFGVVIPQQAQIGVAIVIAVFNTLPGAVAPVMGQLQSMAQQTFTTIGQLAMLVAQGVNTAYQTAESDANGYLNSMRSTAQSIFQAIGTSATAVTTGVNNAYRTAESDSNGYLNSMRGTAQTTFAAISNSAMQVANGVNTAFSRAEQDATGYLNSLNRTAATVFAAISRAAQTAAQNVANIGGAANAAASAVSNLRSQVESLPNISRTITYTIRTVGSAPAFQFGGNMIVDKPSMFIAGEANRKERVKVSPGTMAMVEDLSRDLREKFSGGHMGTSSGWGGLGGMGAHIAEFVNNFLDNLFHKIGWPFFGDFPGGGGHHGGGGGGGSGGGGGTPTPPDRFLKNPSMKNFGVYPVGHPLEGMPILTDNPGAVHNGAFEEPYPNMGTASNTGGGGSGGTTGGDTGGGGGGSTTGGTTGTGGSGSDISQIISQINSISQTSNMPGQNNTYSHENINNGSNVIPLPGTGGTPITNIAGSVISQSNVKNNVSASGNTSAVSTNTRVVHEQPVPITLEIDGSVLTKKIIKLVMEELNNAGVYG